MGGFKLSGDVVLRLFSLSAIVLLFFSRFLLFCSHIRIVKILENDPSQKKGTII